MSIFKRMKLDIYNANTKAQNDVATIKNSMEAP